MRLAARSTVIAAALVIAAVTASAATAQFSLGPRQPLFVNPSTGYPTPALSQSQTTPRRPEAHPGPHRQTQHAGLVAPPTSGPARHSQSPAAGTPREQALANHVPRTGRQSNAEPNARATTDRPIAAAETLKAPSSDFDWGDAAIGAGIAAAIALLITAGAQVVRQRSQLRHP
jgi:hypothetical protein